MVPSYVTTCPGQITTIKGTIDLGYQAKKTVNTVNTSKYVPRTVSLGSAEVATVFTNSNTD